LFDQAIDLDPAQLTTFLDEQCAGDADLRAAVVELLQLNRRAEATECVLRSPVAAARRQAPAPPAEPPPAIGRYRLLRVLGEGAWARSTRPSRTARAAPSPSRSSAPAWSPPSCSSASPARPRSSACCTTPASPPSTRPPWPRTAGRSSPWS